MTTIADAAIEVVSEKGDAMLWFGDSDAWHEAYSRAGGKQTHPMNVWRAVQRALNQSGAWRHRGYIRAISWAGDREIAHKVYQPIAPNTRVQP